MISEHTDPGKMRAPGSPYGFTSGVHDCAMIHKL